MTALVGLADSLVNQRPSLDGQARETAIALRDQSESLAGMVGNLLDLAKLHAGKIILHKEWQPIDEVIGSSLKLLARALADHPVRVALAEDLGVQERGTGQPVTRGQ